jgi:four helix bundle protein
MKDEEDRIGPEDLRTRTKRYALDVIAFYVVLPGTPQAQVMGRQMLRSGTSVGAHYREACRARSDAEFISKIEGGLQELDETGVLARVDCGVADPRPPGLAPTPR